MVCLSIYVGFILYAAAFASTYSDDYGFSSIYERLLAPLVLLGASAVLLGIGYAIFKLGVYIYEHCPFGK